VTQDRGLRNRREVGEESKGDNSGHRKSRSWWKASAWFVLIGSAVMFAVPAMVPVCLFFPPLSLFWRVRHQAVDDINVHVIHLRRVPIVRTWYTDVD